MAQEQITTLTFFRYTSLQHKIWAFGMMQFAHKYLRAVKGQLFYKVLGSGKAGFNPAPDWSVYALLQVWENEAAAKNFFKDSALIRRYIKHSSEHWTLFLKNIVARGEWAGQNPFAKNDHLDPVNEHIAVITRATIRTRQLIRFWRSVPASQKPLHANPGLLFTKGIGEVPFVQMATFSIWKDRTSLDEFAYRSDAHVKVIGKTRTINWYKEELFSRFQPYRSTGSWHGVNPLPFLEGKH
jgi:hypothetical protein